MKGSKLALKGIARSGKLNFISSSTGKILRKGQGIMTHLFMVSTTASLEDQKLVESLQRLLEKYEGLFVIPKTLPPAWPQDQSL